MTTSIVQVPTVSNMGNSSSEDLFDSAVKVADRSIGIAEVFLDTATRCFCDVTLARMLEIAAIIISIAGLCAFVYVMKFQDGDPRTIEAVCSGGLPIVSLILAYTLHKVANTTEELRNSVVELKEVANYLNNGNKEYSRLNTERNKQLEESRSQIEERDRQIDESKTQIEERNRQLEAAQNQISELNTYLQNLESALGRINVAQDKQTEVVKISTELQNKMREDARKSQDLAQRLQLLNQKTEEFSHQQSILVGKLAHETEEQKKLTDELSNVTQKLNKVNQEIIRIFKIGKENKEVLRIDDIAKNFIFILPMVNQRIANNLIAWANRAKASLAARDQNNESREPITTFTKINVSNRSLHQQNKPPIIDDDE